jgi:hypothetical protein
MKKQNGITLVALVITIIVLLILAGVSISLALGNNGVLTRSSQAVVQNEKGTVEQDIKLGTADCITGYWTAWATNASVKKGAYFTSAIIKNSATAASDVVITHYANKDSAAKLEVATLESGVEQTAAADQTPANDKAYKTDDANGLALLAKSTDGYIRIKYTVKSSGKIYYAVASIADGNVEWVSDAQG